MPISVNAPIRPCSQEEFGEIAFECMRHAFDIHNEMGRFFDEPVYQAELANRLGPRALREVRMVVSHQDFEKWYRLDLLVDHTALFELKVVEKLHEKHRGQLIHYLMLAGLTHGKLANFRTESVEHEFVNCNIGRDTRTSFQVRTDHWDKTMAGACRMQEVMIGLLSDWGTGLDLRLYTEALTHFFGGKHHVEREIEILSQGQPIAWQKVRLIDDETAFKLTAFHDNLPAFESHTRRFLEHTCLKRVLWVNLRRQQVEFRVIER